MPKQGVTSMFTFGKHFGYVIMALVALEFPFDFVTPQQWQKELGVLSRGQKLSTTEKKRLHRDKAWRLFPKSKPTHFTADALLIAEFCRRRCCIEKLGESVASHC
jgi:crossover junction endodeoxyribonuclease RuvC